MRVSPGSIKEVFETRARLSGASITRSHTEYRKNLHAFETNPCLRGRQSDHERSPDRCRFSTGDRFEEGSTLLKKKSQIIIVRAMFGIALAVVLLAANSALAQRRAYREPSASTTKGIELSGFYGWQYGGDFTSYQG